MLTKGNIYMTWLAIHNPNPILLRVRLRSQDKNEKTYPNFYFHFLPALMADHQDFQRAKVPKQIDYKKITKYLLANLLIAIARSNHLTHAWV